MTCHHVRGELTCHVPCQLLSRRAVPYHAVPSPPVPRRTSIVQLTALSLSHQTPGDATLLRFLRGRDFHVERAREMISASLVWRKKYQVDRILQEYQSPSVVKDHFPGGWHHSDRGVEEEGMGLRGTIRGGNT